MPFSSIKSKIISLVIFAVPTGIPIETPPPIFLPVPPTPTPTVLFCTAGYSLL